MHGTISHMPPETLSAGHTISCATDIWSFGMLLWELWTRRVPFDGLSPQAVVEKVLAHELPPWPPKTPPVLEQIAGRCWSRVRPSASDSEERSETMWDTCGTHALCICVSIPPGARADALAGMT